MSTPQHKHKENEPVYELGNLALMSNFIEAEAGQKALDQILK